MTNEALQLLTDNAEYAKLLRSYEQATSESDAEIADAEEAGWTTRLADVNGIDDARLAPMHGKLIAHGLLSFKLTGRTSGVVYRVSADGREALARLTLESAGRAASHEDVSAEAA